MKQKIFLTIFLAASLFAQELQVKAKLFNADQKTGISVFEGNVNIIKGSDELTLQRLQFIQTQTKNRQNLRQKAMLHLKSKP